MIFNEDQRLENDSSLGIQRYVMANSEMGKWDVGRV